MTDPLPLFATDPEPSPTSAIHATSLMTDAQRQILRKSFAKLGVSDASSQFELVLALTGQRIRSVGELTERDAQTLIVGLDRRVERLGRADTGNAWADRDEETWIDKL